MFKLYGFSVSNYYNMVKLALLEKGLPFEEVTFYPTPTPESLAISSRANGVVGVGSSEAWLKVDQGVPSCSM